MARPTKRSPEIEQAILASLQIGNTYEDSCLAAGIDRVTLWRWLKDDATFRNAIERAQAIARQRFVGQVAQAAQTSWQAAMTMLERRDPDHWARRERIDVMMDVRTAIQQLGLEPGDEEAAMAEARQIMARANRSKDGR